MGPKWDHRRHLSEAPVHGCFEHPPSSAGVQSTRPALAGSAQRRGRRPADRTEHTPRQCGLTQLTPAGALPSPQHVGQSIPHAEFPDVSVKRPACWQENHYHASEMIGLIKCCMEEHNISLITGLPATVRLRETTRRSRGVLSGRPEAKGPSVETKCSNYFKNLQTVPVF